MLSRGFLFWWLIVAIVAASPAPAGAHAVLLGTDPGDEAVLESPPSSISLRFSEQVSVVRDGFVVFDARGERVAAGDPLVAGSEVSLPVEQLAEGTYIVSWRVISADSHPISGSFLFSVGLVQDVDQAALDRVAASESRQGWEVLAGIARFLAYLGALVGCGFVLFLVVIDREAQAQLLRAARWCVVLVVSGSVLGVLAQAALTASGSAGFFPAMQDGSEVLQSELGLAALLVSVSTVLLVAVAGRALPDVGSHDDGAESLEDVAVAPVSLTARLALALLGFAALGSFALVGHNRTSDPVWLVSAIDVVHVVAAAVWTGGLVALFVTLRRRHRVGRGATGGAGVVQRFSGMATVSIVVVAVAGSALSWIELESVSNLTSSGYGVALLAKLVAVLVAATGGAYNKFWLVPRIAAADVTDPVGAWTELRQTVAMEAAALVAVLGITAVLVNLTPPGDQVTYEPFAARIEMGDGEMDIVILPARAGRNELHLTFLGVDGVPETGTGELTVDFSLPAEGIQPISRSPRQVGEGHWIYEGGEMAFAGEWTIEFSLLLDRFTEARATVEVPIG